MNGKQAPGSEHMVIAMSYFLTFVMFTLLLRAVSKELCTFLYLYFKNFFVKEKRWLLLKKLYLTICKDTLE